MKKLTTSALPLIIILIVSGPAIAQSSADKIEIGAQVTSLTWLHPDGYDDSTEPGFGGRIAYNFNRKVAVEAEGNLFNENPISDGRAVHIQFGMKAGKRFEKFGVFAKVRPGFLSVADVYSNKPGSTAVRNGFTLTNPRLGRETYFTTDVGGVLELYPTARTMVRFDAGDTIVRYGPHYPYSQLVRFPARTKHNFQFTTGVGIRLGKFDKDHNVGSPLRSRNSVPRFEVGMQFSSLFVHQPTQIFGSCCVIVTDRGAIAEPGFGGRFTYNLNDNIALEAETNFYARNNSASSQPGGHMFQGQFGLKAGKRFSKVGVFGKVRPGFMGFSKAIQLVGSHVAFVPLLGRTAVVGDFRTGVTRYFSNDVGGVIEFYISRRVMTRMDLGDTIVNYGEYTIPTLSPSFPINRRSPETKHNFQYTAGVGFRF